MALVELIEILKEIHGREGDIEVFTSNPDKYLRHRLKEEDIEIIRMDDSVYIHSYLMIKQ